MKTVSGSLLAVVLSTALLAACTDSSPEEASPGEATEPVTQDAELEPGEDEGRVGSEEAEEEAELTEERLEAFEAAQARGWVGTRPSFDRRPAPGWHHAQLLNRGTDDWEPAVAADPNAPYVYMLTTRYGEPAACPHCPTPYLPLTVSKDGGRTWGPQVPLCICRGANAQYDPTIEVVPGTGDVYAAFLNDGFKTDFIRSDDHGKTWTKPVHVYGNVAWTDKPEITSSANGRHVYVSWNGPKRGDLYVGVSHDFGATWSPIRLSSSKRYYYAYDGTVLPDGTVVFSESSLRYTGEGGAVEGRIWHHALISRDRGRSWHNVVVDKVANGVACVAQGCYDDFYTGQTSVASDPAGNLVFAYEGARRDQGLQQVYTRTSDDAGRTWSRRVALSPRDENATGPRVDFAAVGKARIWYMQTAGGQTSGAGDPDAWNVRFRRSGDGGRSWGRSVTLSDAESGPHYIGPKGFKEIYGDYGEIAVTNAGRTIAVWGEGFSYTGPGGTWFAIQK